MFSVPEIIVSTVHLEKKFTSKTCSQQCKMETEVWKGACAMDGGRTCAGEHLHCHISCSKGTRGHIYAEKRRILQAKGGERQNLPPL